jgi:hypothetical protein
MDSFGTIMEVLNLFYIKFYENEFSHGGIGLGINNLIGSYFEILKII